MEETIEQQITELGRMTVGQLKQKYIEVFGEETRSNNRQFLFRRIAWRIQALAEGGLSERARRRALELANDADRRGSATPSKPPSTMATAGSNTKICSTERTRYSFSTTWTAGNSSSTNWRN